MKITDTAAIAAALLALAGPAIGSEKASCTTEAKQLHGDDREKALAQCEKLANGAGHSQQEKMKTCNADAKQKELKGDERRAFMSRCLKG